jgi:hypothetical protein
MHKSESAPSDVYSRRQTESGPDLERPCPHIYERCIVIEGAVTNIESIQWKETLLIKTTAQIDGTTHIKESKRIDDGKGNAFNV